MAIEYRLSYTAQEIDAKLGQIDNLATKNEVPSKTSDLINDSGFATQSYVNTQIAAIPTPDVSGQINTHNTATESHNDIRLLVSGLTTRLNALADSDDITLDQMSEIVAYIKSNKELIESVTTNKVNISDIIDNLTTNASNKPLSAAQGVALKALIDAIVVPTKVSELTNDKGYLTTVPSEYITETELNAKGYLTEHQSLDSYAKTADLGNLATKDTVAKTDLDSNVQASLNKADSALQSYTETDPTIPDWAKAANKPTYTASEVGADASGTAESLVTTHNTATDAHADIREEISELSSKIVDEIAIMTQDEYASMTQSNLAELYVQGVRMIAITDSTYSNLVPISIDEDGNVYNGTGYMDGYCLAYSTSATTITEQSGFTVTGFIPVTCNDTVRMYGATWGSTNKSCISYFDENKKPLGNYVGNGYVNGAKAEYTSEGIAVQCLWNKESCSVTTENGVATFNMKFMEIDQTAQDSGVSARAGHHVKYMRISAEGNGANMIITVNEEITEV